MNLIVSQSQFFQKVGAIQMDCVPQFDLYDDFGSNKIRERCSAGYYTSIDEFRYDLLRYIRFIEGHSRTFIVKSRDAETGKFFLEVDGKDVEDNLKSIVAEIDGKSINGRKVVMEMPNFQFSVQGVAFRSSAPGVLSLFHGFDYHVAPHDDLVLPFLEYLKEIIANGSNSDYEYVLDWLGTIVQNPGASAGSALVLIGLMGTGKSFFCDVIARMLNGYSVVLPSTSCVTRNFNSIIEYKMLVGIDDQGEAQSDESYRKLLTMISSGTTLVEKKFRDQRNIKNTINYIICSNFIGRWTGRRFCTLEVSSQHCDDREYFGNLLCLLTPEFFGAFLAFLMARDVSKFNPIAPLNDIKVSIELANADDVKLFVVKHFKELSEGMLCKDAWRKFLRMINKPNHEEDARLHETFGAGMRLWARKVAKKREKHNVFYFELLESAKKVLQKLLVEEEAPD